MRGIISSLIVAVFCITGSSATFAQMGVVKEGAKKAGSATKQAGKATVDTTKKAATATEKGAKKVTSETKDAVQSTYVCADGKTDQATLKANACKDHGGVRSEHKPKTKH